MDMQKKKENILEPSRILAKRHRMSAGLTQGKLAGKMRIRREQVSQIERGIVGFSAEILAKWARACGVEPDEFYPVRLADLQDKATKVLDEYFDAPTTRTTANKDAQARLALEVAHLNGRVANSQPVATSGKADWRNPELLPFTSERSMYVKSRRQKCTPVVMVGPTRCGKTFLGLEDVISLHFDNPGLRSFVCRSDAVDLQDTIRPDIRELSKYSLDDPLSPISAIGRGGARNFRSLEINGGEMVIGGLNRDSRLLGTSFDVIYASQLETIDERSFQKMLTRCAGDAGNLKDADGNNYGLFLSDANPAPDSEHWVLKYAEEDKIEIINFNFEDNPLYYDRHGEQTNTGNTVITQLDESLEGIYHDLYFKGLWADIAGKLFNFNDNIHFVDAPKDLAAYEWYRGIDFGITSPSVCVWFGVHRDDKHVYVHREFRHTKTDTIKLGHEINHYTQEDVENTVIDNDENAQIQLKRDCEIVTVMTKKSSTSVMDRIHILQNLLNRSVEGAEGGIYFNRSLRCNNDPLLARDKKPLSTVEEIKKLYADDNDKIVGSDHGVDALTYGLLWLATKMPKIKVDFKSTTASVERKHKAW